MVPVLEQWVKEGNQVLRSELQWIIKRLRSYKRYKHALEVQILLFVVVLVSFKIMHCEINCLETRVQNPGEKKKTLCLRFFGG